MKNFVDSDTIIVSLMNGIDSEIIIDERYGINHIVHTYVIAINAVREKNIINFKDNGQIVFGNSNGIEDRETGYIKHLFNNTGITYKISDEILKKSCWKFMLNVGLNQVSSILNAPYGVFSELAPESITSMLQDVRAKRKTEVEMLSGQVIEFGEKYSVAAPVNNLLYKMIKTIEFANESK